MIFCASPPVCWNHTCRLLRRDDMSLWHQDKGPATPFIAVILFARVNVSILLSHLDPHWGHASRRTITLSSPSLFPIFAPGPEEHESSQSITWIAPPADEPDAEAQGVPAGPGPDLRLLWISAGPLPSASF